MKPAQVEGRGKPAGTDGRMKIAQWTAILVLALMVGGISFVSVYLGNTNRDNTDTSVSVVQPSMNFPFKSFPRENERVLATEVGHVGHQDYWFLNEGEQDVLVGLIGKGCTCSEVELTVAPPTWMPYLACSAVTQALQYPLRGLDNLTILAAANDRTQLYPELPYSEGTMLNDALLSSATVPAGAVGRVRLSWKQQQIKPMLAYAELWMGQRNGNTNARLEAGARIAAPWEVNKEITLDAITERELEKADSNKEQKGRRGRGWIICFSLTRPSFRLKAEMLRERPQDAQSDPVELGEPIPLEPAALRRIEESGEMHRLIALSGYRIPVTVRPRAKDGTPMEWGRFHRVVQLSSPDEGIDPTQIQIMGEVTGDISVGIGDEMGSINLGPFRRTHGTRRSINLETDEKSIDLELDQSRKPKFLNVTLSAPQEAPGHRSWVLRVEVPPNAARGDFPRADNPDYRDSAIYVKTKGGKSGTSLRSIRIPVRGVANEG